MSPAGPDLVALKDAIEGGCRCFSYLGPISHDRPEDSGGVAEFPGVMPEPAGRALSFSSAAAREALAQAGVRSGRLSLSLGTALADSETLEREVAREPTGGLSESATPRICPFDDLSDGLVRELRDVVPEAIWLRPSVFSVTCVSGLCAFEQAAADLALDRADVAIVGGVDLLSRFMHSGFKALGALCPSGFPKPFEAEGDGILIGEGAAFIVLEPMDRASARGAKALGCVAGQSLVSDSYHMTSPDAEGHGMARAIARALEESGLAPEALGGVTVTAIGSRVYDRMLAKALIEALGPEVACRVPVSSWEGSTGHLLAATGVVGYVHACLALAQGFLDPVSCSGPPDPECPLRYVASGPEPLMAPSVLALTVGFGGQNGAAVITQGDLTLELASRMARRASNDVGGGR